MSYKLKIVNDEKSMSLFQELPYRIYRNDKYWIPPVESEVRRVLSRNNPYFDQADRILFLGYLGSEVVSRCMVLYNRVYESVLPERMAFFGFFECVDDQKACNHLMNGVIDYCRSHWKVNKLEGPFNPNHYSELGLLVENFSTPVFFETYNPPYYQDLLKGAGFDVVIRLHTRRVTDTSTLTNNVPGSFLEKARGMGYTLRNLKFRRYYSELEVLRSILNDAFSDNWHFLSLSNEEYRYAAKSMFLITRPSLIKIVEYRNEPVGVLQFVMNINQVLYYLRGKLALKNLLPSVNRYFEIDEIILYAIGVKKACRNGPAFQLLLNAYYEMASQYRSVYTTWISPGNKIVVNAADRAGLIPYKWFHVFGKYI